MSQKRRFACPCCECLTLSGEPPGTYEVCPICDWEDDAAQGADPELEGGANAVCLGQARANFRMFGAADRAGEVESAGAQYEEVLATGNRSLDVLLNLALLYWQATDPGLAAAKNIGPDFFARAGRRFPELLEEATRLYPSSTAVRFWKRYIAWADLGEPFDVEESRQLLREDPAVLVPAMHVFAASGGRDMETEAHELLRQCREDGTTGAQYVVSVIEAVMKRAGQP